MNIIFQYLIGLVAVMGMSALASFLGNKYQFSLRLFVVAFSIGLCILIWKNALPIWMIILVILLILAMIFGERIEDKTGVPLSKESEPEAETETGGE